MSEDIRKTSHTKSQSKNDAGWSPYLRAEQSSPQPWPRRVVWNLSLWSMVVAVIVTLIWGIPQIEKRLNSHSLNKLQAGGIDTSALTLRWSYRDLDIHGELPHGISNERVIAVLRQNDGENRSLLARGIRNIEIDARSVETPASVVPEALPLLSVTLVMQRNTATLDGVVESAEQRRALVDALLATGVENIHDNLEVSDIGEDVKTVDVKVGVLSGMVQAVSPDTIVRFFANLDRSSLDYHVSTLDRDTAMEIENAASVAIVNFEISGEATVAQNAMVNVRVISDSDALTIGGQVFSDEQHRRLAFAAKEAASGSKRIVDNISVSKLAAISPGSDVRIEGLAEIVASFKDGVSGQINMRGNDLSVDASVDSETIKVSLQEVAAYARGKGISVTDSIVVGNEGQETKDPAQTLQTKLDALAARIAENVIFKSGDSRLSSDAKFTLDLVGEVLAAYPDLKVEIEGHTDNVGRAAVNEELSRKRASAVRRYLIERSIEDDRLVAVGYGSRKPLVPNETSEGRKKNRRVHFHVPSPQQLIEQ